MAFDPTSGNIATIPTQGTTFVALTPTVTNGVMYGGGRPLQATTPGTRGAGVCHACGRRPSRACATSSSTRS